MENHDVEWVNPLFLCPFSITIFVTEAFPGAFPAPPLVRPELTAEEVQLAKGAFAMLKLSLPDVCGVPDADEDDDGEPLVMVCILVIYW